MNSSGSGVKNTICFVILFLLIVDDSYQLQIERYEPIGSRTKRQATCTNRQFQCKDGGCIPRYELCDGEVNCDDRSDETVACRNINLSCPAGSFRCNYGACIPGTQECDGEKNCVDNSDENSPKCSGRATTPPVTNVACRNNQFRCRNGQCIARYSRCDGAQDCTDGSDETEELCSNEKCDTNLFFQCKYGACVDKAGRCNKEKDCADNSDEDPAMCGYSVTSKPPETVTKKQSAGDCQLPEQPEFGRYLINWTEQKLPAGSWVASGTNLVYSCRSVYRLNTPNNFIPCFNGTWQGRLPQCVSTCFPRISNTVDLTCTLNGIPQNCSDRLLEGTVVKMECKPYHVLQVVSNALSKELKCKDGSWNNPLLPCVPVCGKLDKRVQLNCVNCGDASIIQHPWHVGVYKMEDGVIEHICGGSIINYKVILSAAHCFSDPATGERFPPEWYYIAAGKNYREYNDERDKFTVEKRRVIKILIPDDYKAYTLAYSHDIALAVLDKPLTPSEIVTSVCIGTSQEPLNYEDHGTVVGWGKTIAGGIAGDPLLKRITVPLIQKDTCHKIVPKDFQSFVTADKFCAGYTNGSSVCQGDSGGGLITRKNDLYYIRGIVSNGPIKGQACDNYQIAVYTLVSQYEEFIGQHREYS